jgi:hypothetical protein
VSFLFGFGIVELLDRERLTGEAALAYEEVFRREQPHVARDHVAGGQLDDVPGHQVPERHLPRRAVPNHRGGHMDHGLELLRGGVRPGFLPEAESHAQRHHTRHHEPARASPVSERNCRQSQQDHQRVADDFQKADGPALLRSCATSFGPVVRARSSASACVRPLRDVRKSRSSSSPSFRAASRTAGETRIFWFFG